MRGTARRRNDLPRRRSTVSGAHPPPDLALDVPQALHRFCHGRHSAAGGHCPVVARATESGAADLWFFIRYVDPQNHLRVRFGGEPARLREIIDWLPELLDPLLEEGRISRWQLDTYEREVERYGGPEGMEISERIFHADSEAVLASLETLAGDRGADWRWRLALVGIDRLLADFGFDLAGRRDVLSGLRQSFGDEFAAGPQLTQQLAQRMREHGNELYELVTAPLSPEHPLAGSIAALDRRSAKLAPLVAELRARESRGQLTVPVDNLVTSYIHMFVNRLIRSDARRHELVLYDLLHRLTMSRLAAGDATPSATARETDPCRFCSYPRESRAELVNSPAAPHSDALLHPAPAR